MLGKLYQFSEQNYPFYITYVVKSTTVKSRDSILQVIISNYIKTLCLIIIRIKCAINLQKHKEVAS